MEWGLCEVLCSSILAGKSEVKARMAKGEMGERGRGREQWQSPVLGARSFESLVSSKPLGRMCKCLRSVQDFAQVTGGPLLLKAVLTDSAPPRQALGNAPREQALGCLPLVPGMGSLVI